MKNKIRDLDSMFKIGNIWGNIYSGLSVKSIILNINEWGERRKVELDKETGNLGNSIH